VQRAAEHGGMIMRLYVATIELLQEGNIFAVLPCLFMV
jgi:hypothetical protein